MFVIDVEYSVTTLFPIPTEEIKSVSKSVIQIIDDEEEKSISECLSTKKNYFEEINGFFFLCITYFSEKCFTNLL